MKKLLLSTLIIFIVFTANAQYKRVKLWADFAKIQELAESGLPVDHGMIKKNTWFIGEFSVKELNQIESLGVEYDVLINDMESYYVEQNNSNKSLDEYPCSKNDGFEVVDPFEFELGSMGGFLTYEEFLAQIDSMAARYPNLISARLPISDFLTHENRSIYWLKISDNPDVDEEEPEVLYTALHHAREPASLSQLIYYMYYLLENYNADPAIKTLVDNTEMYFVPMVNPDGYIQNQSTNPNGGGMWRKNKRDNNGSVNDAGVDLNRNYGYEWGGIGSSGSFNSNTYRGPEPFSEPETQAIKFFTENHNFKLALNYHTYSNLLLFPFGFDNNQFTPHNSYFEYITAEMVRYNNYENMISAGLYPAAGDSDDWMYGGISKPAVLAMTPEVGESFWPASSGILELCRENVYMNLTMARLAGVYAKLNFTGSRNIEGGPSGTLPFEIQNIGTGEGSFQVTFEELSGNLELVGDTVFDFTNPAELETKEIQLEYNLLLDIPDGSIINIVAHIDNGSYVIDEKFEFLYGNLVPVVSTDGESMEAFASNSWNITNEDAFSPDNSITDSPFGNYGSNDETWIQLAESVNLSDFETAFLSFWAKWDIESGWDYAQVMASSDNGVSWTPLCGQYSHAGNNNQDFEQPIYDGNNTEWVKETISLADYVGGNVKFAFRLVSDQSVVGDGFYFDDLEILSYDQVDGIDEVTNKIDWKVFPNPANEILHLTVGLEKSTDMAYEIIDISGKSVLSGTFFSSKNAQIIISDLKAGSYFIRLTTPNGQDDYRQFQKIK